MVNVHCMCLCIHLLCIITCVTFLLGRALNFVKKITLCYKKQMEDKVIENDIQREENHN